MLQNRHRIGPLRPAVPFVLLASLAGLALAINALRAQQTAAAPAIRAELIDRFTEVDDCMRQQDTACALGILDELAKLDDLGVYETARLQYFYGYVYHGMGDDEAATRAFEAVAALPRETIPPKLVAVVLKNLASLYAKAGRYAQAIQLVDQRLALEVTTPTADDYLFKANLLYALDEYAEALPAIEKAISMADPPSEDMYRLRLHFQVETKDRDGAIATLETLNARWPGSQWATQLEAAKSGQLIP